MNATLVGQNDSAQFEIELNGVKYRARIYLDEKGKFMDEEIEYAESGEELDFEGTEGEIREKIVDYLDANWDSLVSK